VVCAIYNVMRKADMSHKLAKNFDLGGLGLIYLQTES